jgi:lipopolysaccharide export system permease protein
MIGALMGLGNLAAGSELVVTRASGVSVWRIAWPVGLAGLTLAVIMYGIGEYAAPPLAQYAKREKTTAKMADVSFAGSSSAWVKDGNLILRVQTGDADHAFGRVTVFELDGPNRLSSVLRAARISVAGAGGSDAGRWNLHDVATSRFGNDRVEADTRSEETMRSHVNPDFLGLAATDPQLLTLHGLASYIDHLRRNNLETAVFEIGFWSRIARLFAVIVVTLLALPFVFGPLRTTGAGTRTVIGVLLGVLFFLITRTVENGGQLFDLNPILVGWLPTLSVTLCTIVAISRTR